MTSLVVEQMTHKKNKGFTCFRMVNKTDDVCQDINVLTKHVVNEP